MKTMKKLVAVALMLGTATVADAGKGGSAAKIQSAIASGGQDAIIAEVERTEGLICRDCVPMVQSLLTDNRYPVRQVAAWWFGKRTVLQHRLAAQMEQQLQSGDALAVRDAADYLGTTKEYKALPLLRAAMTRGGLTPEARLAIVRAAGTMAHVNGNPILTAGMADADAGVRAEAVYAWRDVLGQTSVTPVEPLLADANARVRAAAATVVGAYHDGNAVAQLEHVLATDTEWSVRRDAAWALGRIADPTSRAALTLATEDASPIVASIAKASLAALH